MNSKILECISGKAFRIIYGILRFYLMVQLMGDAIPNIGTENPYKKFVILIWNSCKPY